jgi:hypothetical protein
MDETKLQAILEFDYRAVAMVFMGWFLLTVGLLSSLAFYKQGGGFQFCTRSCSVPAPALGVNCSAAVLRCGLGPLPPPLCRCAVHTKRQGCVLEWFGAISWIA